MNKLIVTAILMTAIFASSAFAINPPVTNPPEGVTGSPILNVSFQVTNDEDSGVFGYWALDDYTKTITVWHSTTPGTDVAYVGYTGTFCTFKNALSPDTGTPEPSDGCGTMTAGKDVTLTSGTTAYPVLSTTVSPASPEDLGGTKADILLGTYALQRPNGDVENPGSNDVAWDWVHSYFSPLAEYGGGSFPAKGVSETAWKFTYTLTSGTTKTWINADTNGDGGNTGDILTYANSPIIQATVNVPPCTDKSQCGGNTPICYNGVCSAMTCGIAASAIDFGSVLPGQTKGDDPGPYVMSTVTNGGTTPTTELDIIGTDWQGTYYSALNTMPVGSTSWSVLSSWHALTNGWVNTGTNVNPGSPLTAYFKLAVPLNTPNDNYAQTITLNAGC